VEAVYPSADLAQHDAKPYVGESGQVNEVRNFDLIYRHRIQID
jgi:hypothetical protein